MALAPRTVQNIPDCWSRRRDYGLAAGFNHVNAAEVHGSTESCSTRMR
jgi:hypothetical protein